jgi:2-methylcitrate dehydratase PrpD
VWADRRAGSRRISFLYEEQEKADLLMQGPVTGPLADFLVSSRWEDVPETVRHAARRSILNVFGTALGGSRDAAIAGALKVLDRFSGPREARVIGRSEKLDMLSAAFVNAASGNVLDFCDTHHPTIIHPSAPVAPALFALAESRKVSGAALLHAFVLGVEVECRLGNAVSPWHYKRGWHITSTCGVFGAGAAVAKILGFDRERVVWTLGNASAQSSGLVETLGTMAKSVGVGASARGGLSAAFFAQAGVTGPAEPVSGPRGFTTVMGHGANITEITEGPGWALLSNTHKPYPCGVVLFPVIDACLDLREANPGLRRDDIASIVVEGHSLLGERADRPSVTTGREAQVSAQHSVAAVLVHGKAGVEQFEDTYVSSAEVLALRKKVRVRELPGTPVEAARVTIELADGRTLQSFIEAGRGTPKRPMSDSDIESKVRELARYGCPGLDPSPLIDAMWSLDRNADAGSVMRLAVP